MLKNENNRLNIASGEEFLRESIDLFKHQYNHNLVYRQWVDLLKVHPGSVDSLEKIPFLPIETFKSHAVVTGPTSDSAVRFTSSSTTSQTPSTHIVNDISLYEQSFFKGFHLFYGAPADYCILALLPNYLERSGSSLVYMCDRLIQLSGHPLGGFFLHDHNKLLKTLETLKKEGRKTLLIGVSYALMDLSDMGVKLNDNVIVMETGGMKGRRKELVKQELHAYLKKGLGVRTVHSEYGMTELLSQAYSKGDGIFNCPPWMRVMTREVEDPLKLRQDGKTGGMNVIDLANVHSCAFIATKDLGKVNSDGSFEIIGRYDHSDVRGCNLMVGGF